MEKFKELKEYCEILEDHTDDMNAKLNQEIHKSRKFYFRMAIAAVALIIGILSIV